MGRELSDALRQIRLLYGVNPEDSIEKYNEFQWETLREMAKDEGYEARMFSPEVHEKTVDKLYDFYDKKFGPIVGEID